MQVTFQEKDGIHIPPRTGRVFALVASGDPAKVVANKLHMSPHTVEDHFKKIRAWAGGKNITAATAKAVALGILKVQAALFMAVLLSLQAITGNVDLRRAPRRAGRTSATRLARRRSGRMVAMFGNDPFEGVPSLDVRATA